MVCAKGATLLSLQTEMIVWADRQVTLLNRCHNCAIQLLIRMGRVPSQKDLLKKKIIKCSSNMGITVSNHNRTLEEAAALLILNDQLAHLVIVRQDWRINKNNQAVLVIQALLR